MSTSFSCGGGHTTGRHNRIPNALGSNQRFIPTVVGAVISLLIGASTPALTRAADAVTNGTATAPAPIPFSELGAKATADYKGEAIGIEATADGARLHSTFQKLAGTVTKEGLWLDSTEAAGGRLRVMATSFGRGAGMPNDECRMTNVDAKGTVSVTDKVVTFTRPCLTEEYSVSVDGVRQDFILAARPAGLGELQVDLALTGAKAEAAASGAKLTLDGSGRVLAYSRLRVTDATGRELKATMEVLAADHLAVRVDDASAAYPVRIDPTFSDADWSSLNAAMTGANNFVSAVVVDGSGNVYIGGNFTFTGTIAASRIAKWNGSAWSALGLGMNNTVRALAVSGTDLYAAGDFTTAGGVAATRIAKWNGSAWSALGSGMNSSVATLAVSGGNLYAGGSFATAGGVAASRIARWNGATWSALGSGMDSTVSALAVSGTDVYASGAFTTAGGLPASRIAKWNGSIWSALGSGMNANVTALAVSGSDVYAGGSFTTAGGLSANRIAKWNGSIWSPLSTGFNLNVYALAVSGGDLYAGGERVLSGSGFAPNRIAKWNGSAWSALGLGTSGTITALAVNGGNLIVGGGFDTSGGLTTNNLAKWDGGAWSALSPGMDGNVTALAVSGSDLYAGGAFTVVGGVSANYIAKWNGSVWSALGSGLNNTVTALAVSGGDLYAGGSFTTAGGIAASRIAKWNGSVWSALGSGLNNTVTALAVSGGNLYVSGSFTTAGGVAASRVAKWNGSAWSALGSGVSSTVSALVVSGADLYAGGYFTTADGVSASNIAKWNGSAWSALGTGVNASVYALAVSGTDLYVGGGFSTAGGVSAKGVARWNGSAWSALGLGTNLQTYALAVSGGNLYAGGTFTSAGGVAASRIAKWDGSLWSPLGSGMDDSVSALAADASGRVFVGGSFALAGTTVSPFIALANPPSGAEIAVEQPAATNLTDGSSTVAFGATLPGAVVVKTFTVRNTGTATLTLSGITKDGTNAADFTVGTLSSSSLAAGGSATLDVTFNPAAAGARAAAVHIGSNDADENPFDISLTGTGTAPEIAIQQPAGSDLTDGSATVAYGGTLPGTPVVKTFTITNTGNGSLSLSGVSKDGPNATDFSIGALSSSTVAVGGSATFDVTFNPSTAGAKTAAIHVGNTDANENPFDIALTGTGTAPEIGVEQPVSFDLTDGSATVAYGGIAYTTSLMKTFTIRNTGDGALLLSGVTKDGTHASEFSIGALSSSSVAPGGSVTFDVSFSPITAGAKTAAIHIINSDANEGSFDIALTGTGTSPVPEIAVEQPAATDLTDAASTIVFGGTLSGVPVVKTFTVRNPGSATLTLSGITKNGTNAADFTVGALSSSVPAGGSTTFDVTFNPATLGAKTAAIHIGSNDANENPFDISLTGTGAVPEIAVEQSSVNGLLDGGGVPYGSVPPGTPVVKTFTIRNSGDGTLTLSGITKNGTNAADFTVGALGSSVAPGGSTTFNVTFNPASAGVKTAAIQIGNNDSDENPYDINLIGTGDALALNATYNTPADVPVTSAGYNATGRALTVSLNFAIAHGTTLMLVNNPALTPITGTFTGVPHGGTVTTSFGGATYNFIANYWGGDGNDIVLVTPDTKIAAWGKNTSGQLGDGVTTSFSTPDWVNTSGVLSGKVIFSIAEGSTHSLALTSEGKVYAWGGNTYGQLGDGTVINRTTPVAVNMTGVLAGKTVVAIAAGNVHSLALTSEGKMYAWGNNLNNQLGNTLAVDSSNPVIVDMATHMTGKFVIAISSGGNHNLALTSLGEVFSWGSNLNGQVGQGTVGTQFNRPVPVITAGTALSGKTVTAISVGHLFSLVLTSDNKLISWGADNLGQLGNGATIVDTPLASFVDQTGVLAGKTVTAISAGGNHALALTSDGKVFAWGNNGNGQTQPGITLTSNNFYPTPVSLSARSPTVLDLKIVRAISAAQYHNLFLTTDDGMYACGSGVEGQLGNGPSGMVTASNVVAVDRSVNLRARPVLFLPRMPNASHSMVAWTTAPEIEVEDSTVGAVADLTDGGSSVHLGNVLIGQNSTRTFTIRNTGTATLLVSGVSIDGANATDFSVITPPAASVAAAGSTTFVVRFTPGTSGTRTAALHVRNTDANETPFDFTLLGTGVTTTAVAAWFPSAATVPITSNGYVATGLTLNASLGFAPLSGSSLTVVQNTSLSPLVGTFTNVPHGGTVNLTFGAQTYSFIANYFGGTGNDLVLMWPHFGIASWGYNSTGNLGNNTTTNSTSPVDVVTTGALAGKTIVKTARGTGATMCLTADGKLYAWGKLNASRSTSVPELINSGALAGVTLTSIAVGSDNRVGTDPLTVPFFLAVSSTGKVYGWGWNKSGQVGDGTSTSRADPVAVISSGALAGKTVVAVAAGLAHSMALSSEGRVYAWGDLVGLTTASGSPTLEPVEVNASGVLAGKTVVAIAAGSRSCYALTADGLIAAWGSNTLGQLGDSTTTNRTAPVLVSNTGVLAGKTVTAIAAGNNHALALTSDGKAYAWGEGLQGTLGNGSNTSYMVTPVAVVTSGALAGINLVAIAAGDSSSYALSSDGLAFAWGYNGFGRLGDGTQTNRTTPVAVSTTTVLNGRKIVGLASGGPLAESAFTIYAKLPPAPEIVVEDITNISTPVNLADGGAAVNFGLVEIMKSGVRTFRIRNIGDANLIGTLSTGPTFTFFGGSGRFASGGTSIPSTVIPAGGSATFTVLFQPIAAGTHNGTFVIGTNDGDEGSFDIALTGIGGGTLTGTIGSAGFSEATTNAVVTNSGYTAAGITFKMNLGFAPSATTSLTIVNNTGGSSISGTFTNVAQGGTVNMVHTTMGFPFAPQSEASALPTPTNTAYSFIANYFGGDGNDLVLVPSTTSIAAAGANASDQLGDGTATDQSTPVTVSGLGGVGARPVLAVAAGQNHSLAVDADGRAFAWGQNTNGQLGDGTNTNSSAPAAVNIMGVLSGKIVVLLAAGSAHSLAMTTENKIYAWGANSEGQLGDGTTTDSNVPVAVDMTGVLAGKSVSLIAAGSAHNLVLTSDGLLYAWGANSNGQLGNSTTTDSNMPVAVNMTGVLVGKTIIAIAAGAQHSLALDSFGGVYAWGANTNGQLGDGTTTQRNDPVVVGPGLFSITAIAAGGSHSLAQSSFGVFAWGNNADGQLGNGNNTQSLMPVPLNTFGALSGKTIAEIAAGNASTHIRTTDGGVYSCGLNTSGQLGDGTTTNRNTATAALTASGGLFQRPAIRLAAAPTADHLLVLAAIAPAGANGVIVFPDVIVEDTTGGALTNLTAGSSAPTFGKVPTVRSVTRTFKITNLGAINLGNIIVTTTGANSSEFEVTGTDASLSVHGINTILEPTESTTFKVVFTPTTTTGLRSTTLRITSDSSTESPFDIALTATTTDDSYSLWAFDGGFINSALSDGNADLENDGAANLLEFAFGLDPAQRDAIDMLIDGEFFYTGLPSIAPAGQGALQRLRVTFVRRINAISEGLTYTVQFSDDLITWTDATEPEQLVGGDAEYQVIIVDDSLPPPDPSDIGNDTPAKSKRFGRVKVTGP